MALWCRTTVASSFNLLFLLAFSLLRTANGQNKQEITENHGLVVQNNTTQILQRAAKENNIADDRGWMRVLLPASEPTPPVPAKCEIPRDALKVFYGSNLAYCSESSCSILDGVKGGMMSPDSISEPLISVERIKDVLVLSARVFDESGNIVAKVEKNIPKVTKAVASDWTRPDAHEVSIKNLKDLEVLRVRYVNPTTITVEGVFYLPEQLRHEPPTGVHVEISKSKYVQQPGNLVATGNCIGNSSVAFSDSSSFAMGFHARPRQPSDQGAAQR